VSPNETDTTTTDSRYIVFLSRDFDSLDITGHQYLANTVLFAVGARGQPATIQNSDARIVGDRKWHHILAMRRAASMYIYIDGAKQSEVRTSQQNLQPAAETWLRVGSSLSLWPYFFAGAIDDIRIYSVAVTESDVAALYQSRMDGAM
jgi:hypothetical protein